MKKELNDLHNIVDDLKETLGLKKGKIEVTDEATLIEGSTFTILYLFQKLTNTILEKTNIDEEDLIHVIYSFRYKNEMEEDILSDKRVNEINEEIRKLIKEGINE